MLIILALSNSVFQTSAIANAIYSAKTSLLILPTTPMSTTASISMDAYLYH